MGIISKTVFVFPAGTAINHYKSKGYDVKCRQKLEVRVEDLPKCSTALIEVQCEYCGKIKIVKYVDYNANTKNGETKYCCSDCGYLKHQEIMIEKYGKKSPLQVPEIKQKMQETNLERYGKTVPSKNKNVKEKAIKTSLERYGVKNPAQTKEIQDKIKKTNLEKYGVENVFLNDKIKEKASNTIREKYGVENVLLNREIKEKRDKTLLERCGTLYPLQKEEYMTKLKQTNMEKYGVEFASQADEIKQKMRETFLKKYGVNNPAKSQMIQDKIKKTNLERYGVESILSLPNFHENARKIDMERYGVYHHLQNPNILAKQKETFFKNGTCPTSKQQLYLHSLYGGELNYPISYYSADICFPDEKLNIEIDLGGHNLSVKLGSLTQAEFDQKEIIRNNVIKREGYKQMRIISSKDLLPSDEILLQLLSHAKQYFSKYPNHSWINFDIDNSRIINVESKDSNGVFFDYGKLRRITDNDPKSLQETA